MKRRIIGITKIHFILVPILLSYQNCAPFVPNVENMSSTSSFLTNALEGKTAYGKSGLRRLAAYEVVNSVSDVFGTNAAPFIGQLPFDDAQTIPFSNEYGTQSVAPITIEEYQTFSESYSSLFVSQATFMTKFTSVAGCTPASASDRACFIQYLMKMGGKILRRPFTMTEANAYADGFMPIATTEKKFATAVELAIQAWIQHPEFLYRIEVGTPVEPGVIQLTANEVASQMSYLIWGST
ncbi:MAG: DUF1595 domain-containing protein, partial [Bdellovibrionota bacterium]